MKKQKIIGFVPARGGSKSIPKKNIKAFCKKPLIHWCLDALSACRDVDEVVLATDSLEIEKVANGFSLSKVTVYRRDRENAQDTSSTEAVMLEFLEKNTFSASDIFILVQATNPFVRTEDFDAALAQYRTTGVDSLLSCVRTKRFFWHPDGRPMNYDYRQRPRRQDFEGLLMENGAFYINTVGNILAHNNRLFGRVGMYEMADYTGFEIDEPLDWGVCEKLMVDRAGDATRLQPEIALFLTDVDGVLTDAGMYYNSQGDALKKFNTHDGMGLKLLMKNGIKTGIITTENTAIVARRAQKLGVDYLFQGIEDKLSVVQALCKKEQIDLTQVAYIGDDINDLEVLQAVGLRACPANAVREIKAIPGIIQLDKSGGSGAVRAFIEMILDQYRSTAALNWRISEK
ncbi:MAG: HAD hydrolase family protein [Myxococcota bacterium]|nr:HAD hydrolase family protein [Myxococcota bacterium]